MAKGSRSRVSASSFLPSLSSGGKVSNIAGGILYPLLIFILVLTLGSILVVVQIIYTNKSNQALDNNDIPTAKQNFKIASGFVYFFAALMILSALLSAWNQAKAARSSHISSSTLENDFTPLADLKSDYRSL